MPFAERDSLRRAAAAEREARLRAERAREAREHAARRRRGGGVRPEVAARLAETVARGVAQP